MAAHRPQVLGLLVCAVLFALVLGPTVPPVRAATPTIIQTGESYCHATPCQQSLGEQVTGGDNLILGIGLRCSPSCSHVSFYDSLGTFYNVLSASTPITCSSASGMVSDFVAYGVPERSGWDTVFFSWAGSSPVNNGTVFDSMEANNALYLASGTNTGISGTPSLGGSLSAPEGDIFVEFLGSARTFGSHVTSCDQSAGSTPGWTSWGGLNSGSGFYNTAISSTNFPYPPFTDSQTNWAEIGAIFGPSQGLTATSLTCSPGSVAVGTATKCIATVADDSELPSPPTGTVSFSGDSGAFFPSANVNRCTLIPTGSSTSACSLSYVPNPGTEGAQTTMGTYSGDSGHPGSAGTASVFATQRSAKTTVTCLPNP